MIKLMGVDNATNEKWKQLLKAAFYEGWERQESLRKFEDQISQTKNVYIVCDMASKWQKYTSLPWSSKIVGENLIEQLWKCSNCTECLNFMVKRPTVGTGSLEPYFFVVGEAPGIGSGEQSYFDRVFVYGPTSHLLRDALHHLDSSMLYRSWFTNLMKMSFPGNRKGKSGEYNVCYNHLELEFQILKPKTVFALGKAVAEYLYTKNLHSRIVTLVHPSYFNYKYENYKQSSYKDYAFHIKTVMNFEGVEWQE